MAMKNLYNISPRERAERWTNLGELSPMGNVQDTGFFGHELYEKYRSEIEKIRNASVEDKQNAVRDLKGGIAHFKSLANIGGDAYKNYRMTLLVPKFYILEIAIQGNLSEEEFLDAEAYTMRAIELSPMDPEGYWTLSQIYLADKKIDKAKEALAKASEIEPRISLTYKLMLNIAKVTKDEKYFQYSINKAKEGLIGGSVKEVP